MNWATERVQKLRNSVGFAEDPDKAMAAELQALAEECAKTVEDAPMKGNLTDGDEFWRGQINFADDIRSKFPKEEV